MSKNLINNVFVNIKVPKIPKLKTKLLGVFLGYNHIWLAFLILCDLFDNPLDVIKYIALRFN